MILTRLAAGLGRARGARLPRKAAAGRDHRQFRRGAAHAAAERVPRRGRRRSAVLPQLEAEPSAATQSHALSPLGGSAISWSSARYALRGVPAEGHAPGEFAAAARPLGSLIGRTSGSSSQLPRRTSADPRSPRVMLCIVGHRGLHSSASAGRPPKSGSDGKAKGAYAGAPSWHPPRPAGTTHDG